MAANEDVVERDVVDAEPIGIHRARAHRQRERVTAPEQRMMAGGTGDVAAAAQALGEEQLAAEDGAR